MTTKRSLAAAFMIVILSAMGMLASTAVASAEPAPDMTHNSAGPDMTHNSTGPDMTHD